MSEMPLTTAALRMREFSNMTKSPVTASITGQSQKRIGVRKLESLLPGRTLKKSGIFAFRLSHQNAAGRRLSFFTGSDEAQALVHGPQYGGR